jgi:hypothetical protein
MGIVWIPGYTAERLRPTPAVRVTVQSPPKRTVTCGMSAERWMLIQSLRHMSVSSAFVRLIRKRHYLETS